MHKCENHNVHTFDNPAEFANIVNAQGSHYKLNSSRAWVNFLNGTETADLAIKGDDSQVSAAEKLIEKFDIHIDRSQWFDMPSVAGCYPCVPEALAGEPESMREPVAIESESAPITFIVDTTCSGNVSGKDMQKRGTAILAVVMAIAAIRPLTLKVISASHGKKSKEGDSYSIVAVDIPTTPLDLASAAFCMTNVAFARNLMYGYAVSNMGFDGYAWPEFKGLNFKDVETEEYRDRIRKYMSLDGDVVFIPPAFSEDGIIADPEKWVKEQLQKYQTEE